jgi:signal transduction histidine kinase
MDKQNDPLIETMARLRKIEQLTYEFLLGVSFELRTPATSILGFADILLEAPDAPLTGSQRDSLLSMRESARYLLRTVEGTLDTVKVGAGWLELEVEDVDLRQLLEQTRTIISEYITRSNSLTQNRWLEKSPTVEYNIPEELPPVELDKLRIERVLIEILLEAVRLNRKEQSQVTFSVMQNDNWVKFEIIDDGVGLPEHLTGYMPELSPAIKPIIERHGGNFAIEKRDKGWVVS